MSECLDRVVPAQTTRMRTTASFRVRGPPPNQADKVWYSYLEQNNRLWIFVAQIVTVALFISHDVDCVRFPTAIGTRQFAAIVFELGIALRAIVEVWLQIHR